MTQTATYLLSMMPSWAAHRGQSFTYDGLHRLITAGASGGTEGIYGPEIYGYDPTTGNLASKAGVTYTYTDTLHAHAVTALSNGQRYSYDQNGNIHWRYVNENGWKTYNLAYDAENRLTQVSGAATASFGYDGDGQRVMGVEGGITTVYIGNYFEWKGSTSTMVRYYYAGAERVAMRTGEADPLWLLGDHLGSTSVAANYDGSLYTRQGYKAWGEKRFIQGISPLPTTFRYTGQRESETFGLYFYGARWYDSYLNRWAQPDSIVPLASQGTQAWDRYAFVNNNPVRYNDPSGHVISCGENEAGACGGDTSDSIYWAKRQYYLGLEAHGQRTTTSINIDAAGFIGGGPRGTVSIAGDTYGNIALQVSAGGGGYSAVGAGLGPSVTTTNAPSVDKLNGPTVQFGGQFGEGTTINVEKTFFKDSETGELYTGTTIGAKENFNGSFSWRNSRNSHKYLDIVQNQYKRNHEFH